MSVAILHLPIGRHARQTGKLPSVRTPALADLPIIPLANKSKFLTTSEQPTLDKLRGLGARVN